MRRIPLFLLSLLAFPACSLLGESGTEPDEAGREVIDVGASKVEVLDVARRSVAFAFEGDLPTPCYVFEEAVVDRDRRTVHVKVRARSTADFCIAVIGKLDVSPA